MSARDAGHKDLSKFSSCDQSVISTAGPSDKPTWWRRSTRTVPLTGGMIQSGTITDIVSRVGPANTNVPNTAKSAVPEKRRFADNGSNPISASSCSNAFRRTPSPSVSSVNEPVYLFTGGRDCWLIAITADGNFKYE